MLLACFMVLARVMVLTCVMFLTSVIVLACVMVLACFIQLLEYVIPPAPSQAPQQLFKNINNQYSILEG